MAKRIVTAVLNVNKNEEVVAGSKYFVELVFDESVLEELELKAMVNALSQHTEKGTIFGRKKTVIKTSWTVEEIRNAYIAMRKERDKQLKKAFLRLSI